MEENLFQVFPESCTVSNNFSMDFIFVVHFRKGTNNFFRSHSL